MTTKSTQKNDEKESKSGKPKLATMDDRPHADIIIYDGNCVFCEGQVRNLDRLAGERLAFISLHDPRVSQVAPKLTHEMMMDQLYVVTQDQVTHGGAAGLRYLSLRLPKLWWVAPLLHIPFSLPVWQWGYRQIAKRRYKIAGKKSDSCENDSCDIHFH